MPMYRCGKCKEVWKMGSTAPSSPTCPLDCVLEDGRRVVMTQLSVPTITTAFCGEETEPMTDPISDPETEYRDLPVRLTESELAIKANEMSVERLKIKALKDRVGDLNDEKKIHEKQLLKLAEIVKAGEEDRQVECHWIESLEEGISRLVRQDTIEEVDSHILGPDELQKGLAFGDNPENMEPADGETH